MCFIQYYLSRMIYIPFRRQLEGKKDGIFIGRVRAYSFHYGPV
jgi:hypothetical protein